MTGAIATGVVFWTCLGFFWKLDRAWTELEVAARAARDREEVKARTFGPMIK